MTFRAAALQKTLLAAAPEMPAGQCASEIAGVELLCDIAGCIYWPQESLMAVSDLHLEKGATLASRGSLLPPYDTAATLTRLAARIDYWQPRRVISLGDSFHDGEASSRMPQNYRSKLAGAMQGRDWIWISGNHDPEPPQGIGGDCADEVAIGALTFRHAPAAGFVIGEVSGHMHPHARIVRRGKAVRRRCFVTDGARLVMPAFGAFAGGLNIRDQAFSGLFNQTRLCAHMIGRDRLYTIAGRDLA